MESKFKVGDRVRIKGDLTKTEHTIEKITEGYYWLSGTDAFIGGIWLEKIESTDPTTAFLTRLQSLLREFDAEIRFVEDDYSPAIIFMGHKDEKNRFGKFIDGVVLYSNHGCISADSIMDYDK